MAERLIDAVKMFEAVKWILTDADYKSPEQIGPVGERWIERLRRSVMHQIGEHSYMTTTTGMLAGGNSGIVIHEFQVLNRKRGERWHQGDLDQWTPLEWAGAMCGEAGEAANAAKKLRRLHLGIPNREAGLEQSDAEFLKDKIAMEVADTIIYGLLLMSTVDRDAEHYIREVFNQKSRDYGFPETL